MGNVAQLASSQIDSAYAKVEAAFREAITEGRAKPSWDELQLAQVELGWDSQQSKRQFNRVGRVMRFEQQAGTKKQRKALAESLDEATKVAQVEGKKLQGKIDALQKQLADMESQRDSLQNQHTGATQAVESLRELLPPHAEMKHSCMRGQLNETLRAEIHAAESEVRQVEQLLALNEPGKRQELGEALRWFGDGTLAARTKSGYVPTAEWPKYASDLQVGIDNDKAEIAKLREKYDSEIAKINALKDFYVK